MALVSPNYKKARVFIPPKDGTYPAKIVSVAYRQGELGDYLAWKLKIFNAFDPKENEKTVFHNTKLNGALAGPLYRLMKALNPDYAGEPFETNDYVGRTLEIRVRTKPGGRFTDVVFVAPYISPGSFLEAFE